MTAAPAGHRTWKEELLAGQVNQELATVAGRMLGNLHAATWENSRVAGLLDDQSYFQALRVDPYYRRVLEVHPALKKPLERTIDLLRWQRWSLVHGDFSPKNLLCTRDEMMLIDFEVGHYG